ncbi:MAG: DnaT-like ssDNA-binding protein [Psychrobium sp.]
MALTVGTDSYISLSDFKQWALDRAHDVSTYTDEVIEAGIRIASIDFIDTRYTFVGSKVDANQPMGLPTSDVDIADIANATAQAVWLHLQGRLFVDATTISASGNVKSESKSLGALSKSVTYGDFAYTNTFPTDRIDAFLRPYVVTVGSGLRGQVRG